MVIKNFISSFKSCLTNKKKGNIKKFSFNYRNRRGNQILYVDKNALKNLKLFPRRLDKNSKLKVKTKNYDNYIPESDCQILYQNNKYYIVFSKTKDFKNYKANFNEVSLDPGVRTFQTYYSPDGISGNLGDNIATKLTKIANRIDLLKSLRDLRLIKKRKANLKCIKLITKMKCILNDFQWKISHFLVKNFNKIYLPEFGTSKMLKGLCKKTRRTINMLSHYQFKEKMIHQCTKLKRELIICSEEYTSKTCTCCGNINRKLGGNKIYNCTNCGISIDRDLNGARNIYLKNRA